MKKKILTVDDSKPIRMIIQKSFRNHDCQIIEARDGQEGLAMATTEKPDLIILDLTMPVMDGYEMLTKMRAIPELKHIPVVMLTAEAGRDNILRIAKMGVRDYIVKPFKEDVLLAKVLKIIELPLKPIVKKKYNDEINLLVIDDKPAIIAQIQKALEHTHWRVEGLALAGQTVEECIKQGADIIIASLSLPDDGASELLNSVRSSDKTKNIPVLGLCLASETEAPAKARQSGFAGVVTKPIQAGKLEMEICRALGLDVSPKYFQERDGMLVLTLPEHLDSGVSASISLYTRDKAKMAVESGMSRIVVDMMRLKNPNSDMIQFVIGVVAVCTELSLPHALIGSEAVKSECKKYADSENWCITENLAEAVTA